MSHPAGLPDVFLDRSLGRIKVPGLLRDFGLRLTTLAEYFGTPADESIPDVQWLELAGTRQWVVFMKDARIRYNRAEREAMEDFQVRCFSLSNRNLPAVEMANRFIRNLPRPATACAFPGPFIYSVHKDRIERITT